MKGIVFVSAICGVAAFIGHDTTRRVVVSFFETKEDLMNIASDLNPVIGYWDPLGLADAGFWGTSSERTIGWLRQSEIKHGRVAMAAFVGYCVQSNFVFPWAISLDGTPHPSTSLSPPEQWDALPLASKLQIISFIGFLEFYSELTPTATSVSALPHYMSGGVPGKFPTFEDIPHPMPLKSLYDPFYFNTNKSEEAKARGLLVEINNGRLAMLGIIGFLSEQTIPGSIPALNGIVKPYSGQVMAPFEGNLVF